MNAPRVFLSYSHDSEGHQEWVLRLATDLRKNGIDASLDQWDLSLGQDVAAFMTAGISTADRVLLVCTEKYVQKAEAGTGGVGFERLIVTAELVQAIDTKKFLPVVRENASGNRRRRFSVRDSTLISPRMPNIRKSSSNLCESSKAHHLGAPLGK